MRATQSSTRSSPPTSLTPILTTHTPTSTSTLPTPTSTPTPAPTFFLLWTHSVRSIVPSDAVDAAIVKALTLQQGLRPLACFRRPRLFQGARELLVDGLGLVEHEQGVDRVPDAVHHLQLAPVGLRQVALLLARLALVLLDPLEQGLRRCAG